MGNLKIVHKKSHGGRGRVTKAEEIVLTQEVRQRALEWHGQGGLLFGLSDKPDEASIPSSSLAQEGYRAIHQTETHIIGD